MKELASAILEPNYSLVGGRQAGRGMAVAIAIASFMCTLAAIQLAKNGNMATVIDTLHLEKVCSCCVICMIITPGIPEIINSFTHTKQNKKASLYINL